MKMDYLVLRPFSSYGVFYKRNDIVSDDKIRCPRIRVSEGKIIQAVSSSNIPELCDADVIAQVNKEDIISVVPPVEPVAEAAEEPAVITAVDTVTEEEVIPEAAVTIAPKLNFKK